MAKIKTRVSDASVHDFINSLENDQKRQDAFKLLELFTRVTAEEPKMWGSSIIGFGQYHYKSERSSQEDDWMLTGFSPRKQAISLYILHGTEDESSILDKLGKHKAGKGCLYINKLSDVDMTVLEALMRRNYTYMKQNAAARYNQRA